MTTRPRNGPQAVEQKTASPVEGEHPAVPIGAAGAKQPTRLEHAYFEAAVCRNCGAALDTPFCSQCGQKKARRFAWRDLRRETWEHWRLFELTSASTLWRLVTSPGYVAREYAMGMRKRHMHPLKLLLLMVAALVLMLARNRYFEHFSQFRGADTPVAQMAALVQGYANWSFTTGIIAVFAGSYLVFRGRLGYNAIEHAVLAVYCQILVIAVIVLNLVPTLVWTSPDFIRAYKSASAQYLYAFKILIVAVAYRQFFLVQLRREWPRLLAAVIVYLACSWLIVRVYANAVLYIVKAQLG